MFYQPVYDSFLLTMYNITFTGLPVFLFTVLDQNYTETQLLNNFHLYRTISKDASMSWGQFFKWNLLGEFIRQKQNWEYFLLKLCFVFHSSLACNCDILRNAFALLLWKWCCLQRSDFRLCHFWHYYMPSRLVGDKLKGILIIFPYRSD